MGKTEVGGPRGELFHGTGALWVPLRCDRAQALLGALHAQGGMLGRGNG